MFAHGALGVMRQACCVWRYACGGMTENIDYAATICIIRIYGPIQEV